MPPEHPPLAKGKRLIKEDPTRCSLGRKPQLFSRSTDRRAGLDWWCPTLRPSSLPRSSQTGCGPQFDYENLHEKNLEPAPEATRRILSTTLFRFARPSSNTSGVDAFVQDDSSDAYEKLINRLLDSPHYGERWARHWLDVVHFGESNGFEYNQPATMHGLIALVIDALNRDMPHDEFVRQQIAGDILSPDEGGSVAVACLVTGPHNTTKPSNDTMRKPCVRMKWKTWSAWSIRFSLA